MIERTRTSPDWYEHSFGALYAQRYGHRDDSEATGQIEQLVQWLRPESESRVLDVCCGGGRHLEPLRRMGFDAWGVDLSEDLLNLSAKRSNLRGRLVRADVRALPFGPQFDWAVNLFTSFGYFDREEDNLQQLRAMARALRLGGRLVMDLPHLDHLLQHFIAEDVQEIGGLSIVNRRTWTGTHVVKTSEVTTQSGEHHQFVEKVRLYRPDEMSAMADRVGLDIQFHGALDGRSFVDDSPRMVVLGTRR